MDRNNIAAVFIICLAFFFLGRCTNKRVEVVERITVDTVRLFTPAPASIKTSIQTIRIPKLILVHADSVNIEDKELSNIDAKIPFERIEYQDSTFKAVISGISIGGYRPKLEHIEVYNTTKTLEVEQKKPILSPYASIMAGYNAAGIGVGVFIGDKHGVGVDYINIGGSSAVLGRYSFKF
jgi:hypothetical protein